LSRRARGRERRRESSFILSLGEDVLLVELGVFFPLLLVVVVVLLILGSNPWFDP
jgi:hypothetical protein